MIVPSLARMIVREMVHRPINGTLLCLGRQTIAMKYEEALQLIREEGCSVPESVLMSDSPVQDETTRCARTGYITDELFFRLLGIDDFETMDVSEYENADIIHNLNTPVPRELHGKYDFIIDGGTFDHLFDVRVGFENVVNMLTPTGRVFQWNAASNFTGAAYIMFGPDFFYDYYVRNQFDDCRVYVAEVDDFGQRTDWDMYEFEGLDRYGYFRSERIHLSVVMAQKGNESTCSGMPIQSQYRDEDRWGPYRASQERILEKRSAGLGLANIERRRPPESCANRISKWDALRYCAKHKGIVWCAMRPVCSIIERIYVRWLKRFSYQSWDTRAGAAEVEGFRYVGKV